MGTFNLGNVVGLLKDKLPPAGKPYVLWAKPVSDDDPEIADLYIYTGVGDPADPANWVQLATYESLDAKEDKSNKVQDLSVPLTTTYPSTKAMSDALMGYPTSTRKITINNLTQDLSADRAWTVGDVRTDVIYNNPAFINTLAWGKITGTPTDLAGYGITDVYVKSEINNFFSGVNPITGYNKTNWDTAYGWGNHSTVGYLETIEGIVAGGELSGTYASPTLVNDAVISKVLSGYNIASGSIGPTDSILIAFGKLQNQLNGLIGGTLFKGIWDAAANNPTLQSGVGTNGWYYIVNTPGTTNLDGITDWQTGDWAIFSGTKWTKVDNTDAVISVNGKIGIVNLVTTDIPEGTNLYFTNGRAISSVLTGFTSGAGTISPTDTILSAIQKLDGNIALKAPISGGNNYIQNQTAVVQAASFNIQKGYTAYLEISSPVGAGAGGSSGIRLANFSNAYSWMDITGGATGEILHLYYNENGTQTGNTANYRYRNNDLGTTHAPQPIVNWSVDNNQGGGFAADKRLFNWAYNYYGDPLLSIFGDRSTAFYGTLRLLNTASDPAVYNGGLAYRTDLNKGRIGISGVWQNIATEAWVSQTGNANYLLNGATTVLSNNTTLYYAYTNYQFIVQGSGLAVYFPDGVRMTGMNIVVQGAYAGPTTPGYAYGAEALAQGANYGLYLNGDTTTSGANPYAGFGIGIYLVSKVQYSYNAFGIVVEVQRTNDSAYGPGSISNVIGIQTTAYQERTDKLAIGLYTKASSPNALNNQFAVYSDGGLNYFKDSVLIGTSANNGIDRLQINVTQAGGIVVKQNAVGTTVEPSIKLAHFNPYSWAWRLDNAAADLHLDRINNGTSTLDIIKITQAGVVFINALLIGNSIIQSGTLSSDYSGIYNGATFYRTDINKQRIGISGVYQNIATEAWIALGGGGAFILNGGTTTITGTTIIDLGSAQGNWGTKPIIFGGNGGGGYPSFITIAPRANVALEINSIPTIAVVYGHNNYLPTSLSDRGAFVVKPTNGSYVYGLHNGGFVVNWFLENTPTSPVSAENNAIAFKATINSGGYYCQNNIGLYVSITENQVANPYPGHPNYGYYFTSNVHSSLAATNYAIYAVNGLTYLGGNTQINANLTALDASLRDTSLRNTDVYGWFYTHGGPVDMIKVLGEGSYVTVDASGLTRLGLYKVPSDDPAIAAASGTPIRFGHLSSGGLSSGGTFTLDMTIGINGEVSVLRNYLKMANLATAPAIVNGGLWYDTATNKAKVGIQGSYYAIVTSNDIAGSFINNQGAAPQNALFYINSGIWAAKMTTSSTTLDTVIIQNTATTGMSSINFMNDAGAFGGTIGYRNSGSGFPDADSFLLMTNGKRITISMDLANTTHFTFTPGGRFLIGIATDNTLGRLQVNGAIWNVPTALATAASLFYVDDSGVHKTRTAAQVLSDIAAAPISGSGNYIQNQNAAPQTATFDIISAGSAVFRTSGTSGQVPLAVIATNTNSYSGMSMLTSAAGAGGLIAYVNSAIGNNPNTLMITSNAKDIVFTTTWCVGQNMVIKPTGNVLFNTTVDNGTDRVQVSGNVSATKLISPGFKTNDFSINAGGFYIQSYVVDNVIIGYNTFWNGSGYSRVATGYIGKVQWSSGEYSISLDNTGNAGINSSVLQSYVQFKIYYNGTVALGGNISGSANIYTGASVVISPTLLTSNVNVIIGNITPLSTASTASLSLGATYSPTNAANLKIKLYDDGNAANVWGFGMSNAGGTYALEYVASSAGTGQHRFYGGPIVLPTTTADFGYANGGLEFRSDLNKIRMGISSSWVNIASESWVTAGYIQIINPFTTEQSGSFSVRESSRVGPGIKYPSDNGNLAANNNQYSVLPDLNTWTHKFVVTGAPPILEIYNGNAAANVANPWGIAMTTRNSGNGGGGTAFLTSVISDGGGGFTLNTSLRYTTTTAYSLSAPFFTAFGATGNTLFGPLVADNGFKFQVNGSASISGILNVNNNVTAYGKHFFANSPGYPVNGVTLGGDNGIIESTSAGSNNKHFIYVPGSPQQGGSTIYINNVMTLYADRCIHNESNYGNTAFVSTFGIVNKIHITHSYGPTTGFASYNEALGREGQVIGVYATAGDDTGFTGTAGPRWAFYAENGLNYFKNNVLIGSTTNLNWKLQVRSAVGVSYFETSGRTSPIITMKNTLTDGWSAMQLLDSGGNDVGGFGYVNSGDLSSFSNSFTLFSRSKKIIFSTDAATANVTITLNGALLVNTIVDNGLSKIQVSGNTLTSTLTVNGSPTNDSTAKFGSIEIQPYTVNNAWFGENVYYDGGNFRRRAAGFAELFYFVQGEGQFRFANNGAAGSVISEFQTSVQLKMHYSGWVALGGQITTAVGSFTGASLYVTGTGINMYQPVLISNLGGTGTRMVVADALGNLSTLGIPGGGGGVSGSGVANQIAVWSSAAVIGGAGTYTWNGTKMQLGDATTLGTATPVNIDLGATYSNNIYTNPKIYLYNSGANFYGLGVTSSQFEFIIWPFDSQNRFVFTGGVLVLPSQASYTGTTLNGILYYNTGTNKIVSTIGGGFQNVATETWVQANAISLQSSVSVTQTGSAWINNSFYVGAYAGAVTAGRISVSGPYHEISLLARNQNAWVENPTTGERWAIFADVGQLKFWSGADRFKMTATGDMAVGGRAMFGTGGFGTFGIEIQTNSQGLTPTSQYGFALGWNKSGGNGESNFVWCSNAGTNRFLQFAYWDGTTYKEVGRWQPGGDLMVFGQFVTAAPSGTGAGSWMLGKAISATVSLNTTKYLEIKVDNVVYKLLVGN